MKRPVGVTVLAIVQLIAAALLLLIAVKSLLGYGRNAGLIGATISFALAALALAMGAGLLKLKNWARILSIAYAFVVAAMRLLGILGAMATLAPVSALIRTIQLGLAILVIWYLSRADVKKAFA